MTLMSDDDKKYFSFIDLSYRVLPTFPKHKMPIVDIKLPGLPQATMALVDSGASSSLLHEIIADVVGLKRKGRSLTFKGRGVSGEFSFWRSEPIPVNIEGHSFEFLFDIPVENKDLPWPCILGHDTLFRVSKVEFRSFKDYFRIAFRKDIN